MRHLDKDTLPLNIHTLKVHTFYTNSEFCHLNAKMSMSILHSTQGKLGFQTRLTSLVLSSEGIWNMSKQKSDRSTFYNPMTRDSDFTGSKYGPEIYTSVGISAAVMQSLHWTPTEKHSPELSSSLNENYDLKSLVNSLNTNRNSRKIHNFLVAEITIMWCSDRNYTEKLYNWIWLDSKEAAEANTSIRYQAWYNL